MNTQITLTTYGKGFSLIELMVSLVIGLFLIGGIITVYSNSRTSQNTVDDQVVMVDNARFALDVISADIRQAGVYGRLKEAFRVTKSPFVYGTATCVNNTWVQDVEFPLRAFDNSSSLFGSCAANYLQGDVLEVRYSLLNPVPVTSLQANKIYINGDYKEATFFMGDSSPNIAGGADYEYVANAYYIASYTDAPGDGMPSLHRLTLQPGSVVDQVLLAGVEDMQIQIGMDLNEDGHVDSYVNPGTIASDNIEQWHQAISVQVWLVVRSLRSYPGLNTVINADIAGNSVTLPVDGVNDGIRRVVVSTVARLRNRQSE